MFVGSFRCYSPDEFVVVLCMRCMLYASCFNNNFSPIDTVFRNKCNNNTNVQCNGNCKNNEKTEFNVENEMKTKTQRTNEANNNEEKKNTRASHRSAKEIKLFILYGADKKRIFTHSATNKVIC